MMIGYETKKSNLSIKGFFTEPAFRLFHSNNDSIEVVTRCLSRYCKVQGKNIRINQNGDSLGHSNITFDLYHFNAIAKIFLDKYQIDFFDTHIPSLLSFEDISNLSTSFFSTLTHEEHCTATTSYTIQLIFHAKLDNLTAIEHNSKFVNPPLETSFNNSSGTAVCYYFGQHDVLLNSSVTLDISVEFIDCIFVNIFMAFDANKVTLKDLPNLGHEHTDRLHRAIGLEFNW